MTNQKDKNKKEPHQIIPLQQDDETIQNKFTNYWEYYTELEKEYLKIEEYIPTNSKNFNTFSMKYLKLSFSICSEIDIIFKEFIQYTTGKKIKEKKKKNKCKMPEYMNYMKKHYPKFFDEKIIIHEKYETKAFELESSIAENNKDNDTPIWWLENNNFKHQRYDNDNYLKATQRNILNALAGLYQLEKYFCNEIVKKEKIELLFPSELFKIKGEGKESKLQLFKKQKTS